MASEYILSTLLAGMGGRLKEFRVAKGMKQSDFSLLCEIEQTQLSKIENGKKGLTDEMIFKICKKFADFDPRYIITGERQQLITTPTEGG